MLMKRILISARMRVPILIFCVWCVIITCAVATDEEDGFLVRRENRTTLVSTENGEILAARLRNDLDGSSYLLHFFTMDPNSLFLPVILHSDMVFYVHTGSGKLSWTEESELKTTDLRRGDVYRLKEGAVFFIQSNLETETERRRLRIIAIFANSNTDLHEPPTEPYSCIRDMVLGFNKNVLQAAFKVSEEEIEELLKGTKLPAIIHEVSKTKFLGSLVGSRSCNIFELNKKKGKESSKSFNLFKEDKDFENCNGWSTAVTRKKLSALKGSSIGLFMVNLTTGSMMGPHWNPMATEIAVVLQGRGMVRVVCPSFLNETGCRNMRFEVEEGDIFGVPRFHPMAQLAFNNETFVFMGFSNSEKKNHPQFLAGEASVLRALNKDVLAVSFNVKNTTLDQLLASQHDSVILGCISCAEEELKILEEDRDRAREEAAREREEERQRKEEEAREKEEEEAKRQEEERRRREEEETRREEEEESRKREEERWRKEEAAREKKEEEAEMQEEERKRREEEEEETRRREEEESRKREEEEREREEEEAKRQEEERRRQEEREEEARTKEEEQWESEEEEEQEAKQREREWEARERKEEEEARWREATEEERRREKQPDNTTENKNGRDGKRRKKKREKSNEAAQERS